MNYSGVCFGKVVVNDIQRESEVKARQMFFKEDGMDKIVVPTKFNRTGKRVLTDPHNDKWVCAPANRRYRESCKAIRDKSERNKDEPLKAYIEKMSQVIASYVGSESASDEDRYRIIKFLAEGGLREYRDKPPLGDISGLSQMVEEAWQKYNEASGKLWKEREEGLKRASYEHDDMKRALRREISDYFHHQFHPEDDKRIKFEKGEIKKFNISKEKSGELKESKKLAELQDRMHRLREL